MSWIGAFYSTSVGKKAVVAITGLIMVLFLMGHMMGNLLVFEGRGPDVESTKLNEYSALLRTEMLVLWAIRAVLLSALVLHVATTIRLVAENRAARPDGYARRTYRKANVYSRTMAWGGLALFGYIVYHILHLTAGVAHPGLFTPHDVYSNVVRGFQNPMISGVYIAATVALFFHLTHGVQSLFRTLGVNHPRHLEGIQAGGRALAAILVLGFLSVPVSVLLGIVK